MKIGLLDDLGGTTQFSAKLIAVDAPRDLAVLRIDAPPDMLHPIRWLGRDLACQAIREGMLWGVNGQWALKPQMSVRDARLMMTRDAVTSNLTARVQPGDTSALLRQ